MITENAGLNVADTAGDRDGGDPAAAGKRACLNRGDRVLFPLVSDFRRQDHIARQRSLVSEGC